MSSFSTHEIVPTNLLACVWVKSNPRPENNFNLIVFSLILWIWGYLGNLLTYITGIYGFVFPSFICLGLHAKILTIFLS